MLSIVPVQSTATMTTSQQYLDENCRAYCMHRMRHFAGMAQLEDPKTWELLRMNLGGPPLIWEYIEYKLRRILAGTKRIGQSGWAWHETGVLCRGFACVAHCSDDSQRMPYLSGEMVEWWPIIWLEAPHGGLIFPMMCPALAWQNARPWSIHISRVWRCVPEWLRDDDSFSHLSSTTALWEYDPAMSHSESTILAGWCFAEAAAELDNDDIALLDDVASEVGTTTGWTEVAESSVVASEDACASESTESSGRRNRRWGKRFEK